MPGRKGERETAEAQVGGQDGCMRVKVEGKGRRSQVWCYRVKTESAWQELEEDGDSDAKSTYMPKQVTSSILYCHLESESEYKGEFVARYGGSCL